MVGVVLGAPFMLIGLLLGLLATGAEVLQALLATKEERDAARSERQAAELRDRAVTEHGLDKTFDGDWNGAAGGSFVAPDHEFPSHLELTLTVTDSGGKTGTDSVRLDPDTVTKGTEVEA